MTSWSFGTLRTTLRRLRAVLIFTSTWLWMCYIFDVGAAVYREAPSWFLLYTRPHHARQNMPKTKIGWPTSRGCLFSDAVLDVKRPALWSFWYPMLWAEPRPIKALLHIVQNFIPPGLVVCRPRLGTFTAAKSYTFQPEKRFFVACAGDNACVSKTWFSIAVNNKDGMKILKFACILNDICQNEIKDTWGDSWECFFYNGQIWFYFCGRHAI